MMPEPRAAQVADRMVEEAELPRLLPAPGQHRLAIRHHVAAQREDQRERVLGHRVDRIAADVAHSHAARGAGRLVDAVGAGGRHGDELERRQPLERRGGDRRLVGDGDRGTGQALDHLVGARLGVFDQLVRERRRAHADLRRDRRAVEKDDAVAHGILRAVRSGIRHGTQRGPFAAHGGPAGSCSDALGLGGEQATRLGDDGLGRDAEVLV